MLDGRELKELITKTETFLLTRVRLGCTSDSYYKLSETTLELANQLAGELQNRGKVTRMRAACAQTAAAIARNGDKELAQKLIKIMNDIDNTDSDLDDFVIPKIN